MTRKNKVLIVEDEHMHAYAITRALEEQYVMNDTTIFERAEDCILHLTNNGQEPDLILLDHNLPGLSGRDAFDSLQKLAPNTPIIIMSMIKETNVIIDYLKKGAADYIIKGKGGIDRMVDSATRHTL